MNFIIILNMIFMSIVDIKYQEVKNIYMLPLLLFINFKIEIIAIFIILLILFKYFEKIIGGADLKIMMIMYLILSIQQFNLWLLYTSLIALIFCLIFKKKKIPMFPFLTLGYIGIMI